MKKINSGKYVAACGSGNKCAITNIHTYILFDILKWRSIFMKLLHVTGERSLLLWNPKFLHLFLVAL